MILSCDTNALLIIGESSLARHLFEKTRKPLPQLSNYLRNEVLKCATSGCILNVSP